MTLSAAHRRNLFFLFFIEVAFFGCVEPKIDTKPVLKGQDVTFAWSRPAKDSSEILGIKWTYVTSGGQEKDLMIERGGQTSINPNLEDYKDRVARTTHTPLDVGMILKDVKHQDNHTFKVTVTFSSGTPFQALKRLKVIPKVKPIVESSCNVTVGGSIYPLDTGADIEPDLSGVSPGWSFFLFCDPMKVPTSNISLYVNGKKEQVCNHDTSCSTVISMETQDLENLKFEMDFVNDFRPEYSREIKIYHFPWIIVVVVVVLMMLDLIIFLVAKYKLLPIVLEGCGLILLAVLFVFIFPLWPIGFWVFYIRNKSVKLPGWFWPLTILMVILFPLWPLMGWWIVHFVILKPQSSRAQKEPSPLTGAAPETNHDEKDGEKMEHLMEKNPEPVDV